MEGSEPSFFIEDFPIIDGEYCCPRCNCCTVAVGPPHCQSIEVDGQVLTFTQSPPRSQLRREPSTDPLAGPESWYCRGGCDNQGNHPKGYSDSIPTFVGQVRRTKRVETRESSHENP